MIELQGGLAPSIAAGVGLALILNLLFRRLLTWATDGDYLDAWSCQFIFPIYGFRTLVWFALMFAAEERGLWFAGIAAFAWLMLWSTSTIIFGDSSDDEISQSRLGAWLDHKALMPWCHNRLRKEPKP